MTDPITYSKCKSYFNFTPKGWPNPRIRTDIPKLGLSSHSDKCPDKSKAGLAKCEAEFKTKISDAIDFFKPATGNEDQCNKIISDNLASFLSTHNPFLPKFDVYNLDSDVQKELVGTAKSLGWH